ncbi:MAG: hypothetical protein QW238_07005 [Candidatus Bathyarchaeia archaeon]
MEAESMLEEIIRGLESPCEVLRKYSTVNENIGSILDRIPDRPGFFKLDGEPYWLEVEGGRKILYYIYVLGKPPFNSMPSERFPLHAKTLREGASALIGITEIEEADKIIVPEAMGFHIGGVLSAITGKPFIPIARETKKVRRYVDDVSGRELGERISIYKSTGYEVTEMFVYGLNPGDKVILIDTIISTGGTGVGIIKGLRREGIEVLDFAAYVMKVDYRGGEKVRKETGIEPKSLINLSIKDVYERDGKTYAETEVEKSRWWSRGEAASMELEEAWKGFESKIHLLQRPS